MFDELHRVKDLTSSLEHTALVKKVMILVKTERGGRGANRSGHYPVLARAYLSEKFLTRGRPGGNRTLDWQTSGTKG